jgi:tellurite methyltransferase
VSIFTARLLPRINRKEIRVNVADFFDAAYRRHDRYWWQTDLRYSTNPSHYRTSLLTQALLRLIPNCSQGHALDLGAGEGADSIRLARLGYDVEALDISCAGAEKIEKFASAEGVSHRITVRRMDVCDYTPTRDFDIILSNGLLHYIEDKETIIRLMQGATLPNGLNVISLWSSYTAPPACHDVVPIYPDEEDGIVVKLYEGWRKELLYLERDKPETAHSDLPPHRHSHIKMIARKP